MLYNIFEVFIMYKTEEELIDILKELIKNAESECVEFKKAKNNFEIDKLGRYFSAMGNEATLRNRQYSWIVFGIDDKTHEYTDTKYHCDNDFNKVKRQIADNTTDNISFIEIYPLIINGKRVIMFQVPAAVGSPINWKGYPYGRIGEDLKPLSQNKIEQIRNTAIYDWSRQIISSASIDNLDSNAILLAREQFKKKHEGKEIANEIDELSDEEFLNKAKLTLNGKITNTAMLLLGKNDFDYLIEGNAPRMTWKLSDEDNIIDYEHFGIPFLVNIENLYSKIRNLRYRYIVDDSSLFPIEIYQYDSFTLHELINNCIVHQNYSLSRMINVIEFKDKLMFINEGNFIPENINKVLENGFSSPFYRNPFLVQAMVNLNMIDTAGSGIKRIYRIQRDKYFPMPDYDFSEKNRVKVTLYGTIIDEKYSKLLFEQKKLSLNDIVLLDRVQKKLSITKEQFEHLKEANLVEGRYPNIYISSSIAEITDNKEDYILNAGLNRKFYKELIIEYFKVYKKATKKEIKKLLRDKFPNSLDDKTKDSRVRSLLDTLKRENFIFYEKDTRQWILK